MADTPDNRTENISVPVIEEELEVGKRRVEGDRVSVRTVARERTELVEQPLESMEVEIERIAIDREIDTAPDIRNDGDTTIIPVVEERLVVEKRLFLREEIHVHRRRVVTQFRQNVTLRSQEVVVERHDAAPEIRNEGETLIIPVVEERLVVEKRLFLREEIHVHRRRTVTQFRQNVTLRSQEVIVERRDAAGDLERTETPQEG